MNMAGVTAWLMSINIVSSDVSQNYTSSMNTSLDSVSSQLLSSVSARDLIRWPVSVLVRLDNLLVRQIPDYVLEQAGTLLANVGQAARDVWQAGTGHMAEAVAQVVEEGGNIPAATATLNWRTAISEALQAGTFRSYFGMLHYLTSRWAFTCFALALILNRIQIYASTRHRIVLTWEKRLALRLIPILLFITQIHHLLQAIRCQTSPEYSLYRHGDINKYSLLDWAPEGGFLYSASSFVLGSSGDEAACAAVEMSRPSPEIRARYGSFSQLWPTFLRLSLSHLVETLSCHIQQVAPMTEVGMSLFEHSLAFSESETMISHALGVGLFSSSKPASSNATASAAAAKTMTIPASGTLLAISDATRSLTGPHLMDRINVPVEVLLVALLSCCNALTSNIISVFGKQKSLRLINTGFWAVAFMSAFTWGFFSQSIMVRVSSEGGSEDMRAVSGLLHFPTVAIIGFLPHIIIILGMVVCAAIYVIALTITALSLNTNGALRQPTGFIDRLKIAHDNLQVALQIGGINFRWNEDFYTALLRIGFALLTAASEAVFLNEGRSVEMRQFTWLEEDRLDEIEAERAAEKVIDNSYFQIAEDYGIPDQIPGSSISGGKWQSGYARERKLDSDKTSKDKSNSTVYPNPRAGGVGALQRTTRFFLLFIYLRGILYLIGGYLSFGAGVFLDRIGITARPTWLRAVVGRSLKKARKEQSRAGDKTTRPESWFTSDSGPSPNLNVDIEIEVRRRLALQYTGMELEEKVDQSMYDWWKGDRWYGTKDGSGDYSPALADEFDTTSMMSMSSAVSVTTDDHDWESENEGQRTPTRSSPAPSAHSSHDIRHNLRSRSPTPFDTTLDPATLARLLNPQDRAARDEARMLAAHLSSADSNSGIMTRSRYRRDLETERARVLLAGRRGGLTKDVPLFAFSSSHGAQSENRPLTPAEEAEILESLILSRRKGRSQMHTTHPSSDATHPDHTHIPSTAPSPTPSTGDPPISASIPPDPSHPAPTNNDPTSQIQNPSDFSTPPCVVCQSSPRTIIAWPCRCLCLCEDCRVNLALNNFANCVTCRRNVGGFVRLWVP